MKVTTQDCINFIVSQNIPGIQPGVKWKRLSKKNDENKNSIREFQSSNGDLVTVKEEKGTGVLSILDNVTPPVNVSVGDLLEYIKTLPYNNVFDNEKDNLKYKITELVRETIYLQVEQHGYIKENNSPALILCPEIYNKYIKEFGVAFDTENCYFNTRYIEIEKGKNVSIVTGEVYGDWEFPVNFAMYFDKNENKPKVYIPLDDFNMFNRLYKTAYGSEGEYFKLPDEEIFRCDDIKENLQEENNSLEDSQRREYLTALSLENYLKNKKV